MNPTDEEHPFELSEADQPTIQGMARRYGFGSDIAEFAVELMMMSFEEIPPM